MYSRLAAFSVFAVALSLFAAGSSSAFAQHNNSANAVVPTLVQFSGVLADANGKPLTGITGVTFSLYAEQEGGAPLWLETQSVQPDKTGHYSVMLGSNTNQGLPADLFAAGQARWLGAKPQGQEEQPRIMLLSVPYAMKAGDAETLGGKPASAFLPSSSPSDSAGHAAGNPFLGGRGTPNHITKWITSTKLGNSGIFENSGGDVGVGTTSPAAKFDVQGTGYIRDTLTLFPAGSDPTLSISGTAFQITDNGTVSFVTGQTFPGTGTIAVTAGTDLTGGGNAGNVTLNIDTTKVPQLNASNTFTGNQTVNGNMSATGVVTGNGYQIGNNLFGIGLYSQSNAFLGFAGSATVNQNAASDTGVGVGALANDEGGVNTAVGVGALFSNIGGNFNVAIGGGSLYSNTGGEDNTSVGNGAISKNTTGSSNTAMGEGVLISNTTGSNNTASGYQALAQSNSCCNVAAGYEALFNVTTGLANTGVGNVAGKTSDGSAITGKNNTFLGTGTALSTGSLTNATALGANAEVEASNSLVLGSIQGVNGQSVTVNVGIGTTTPDNNLTVNGTADKPGGGSWGTYSDGRLKTLDGTFNSGLSQILKITPVRYRYKADNAMGIRDQGEHIGLVAQEVQKVIPAAVTRNSKGYLLVNNDPIIWTMLNAIKEQQKLIQKQLASIRAQQTAIAQLTSQVTAIQASLKTNRRTGTELRVVKVQPPTPQ